MSSGLVASMAMPAQGAAQANGTKAAPATAPIAVQPALGLQSGLLTSQSGLQAAAAPLSAPAAATVSFEQSAFKAVPKVVKKASVSNGQAVSSSVGGFGSARGSSVLAIAARYIGVPYRYGGVTPAAWDCSAAMAYIFRQVGVELPRTANQQLMASKRISRSEARPGDLVFMLSGDSAYHVGLYAGNNMMYDAGRTGKSFSKREIFTSNVVFGRVLG